MSDMPERIWATRLNESQRKNAWGDWDDTEQTDGVEYIRADHVNELVAAAYADARAQVEKLGFTAKFIEECTPTDATAALAARDARVREAALREAAAKLDDLHRYAKDHHSKDYRQGHEAALAGGAGVLRALAEKGEA